MAHEISTEALKDKLLNISYSGVYAQFHPEQLLDLYNEVSNFLSINSDSIDVTELFNLTELRFYLAILTHHDVDSKACLDRLTDQFGRDRSQRIKILQSIYLEAMGDNEGAKLLLNGDPDELDLSRRLVTFSRNSSDPEEYIACLKFYLDVQPSDLITWAELADQYQQLGHYERAIFCLQEIIQQEPFAYNIFYKIGLNYYYLYCREFSPKLEKKDKVLESANILRKARDHFLRTIEICETYSKAWLGIYLVTKAPINDVLRAKYKDNSAMGQLLSENDKLREVSAKKFTDLSGIDEATLKSDLSVSATPSA
ncbi:Piso0_003070 [Millerozyma farinosa CBS 7064]|uniref:ER membrane protein complex subunit 2 n=1 Tax=Pichia sorbitophila (strain ATCC MYA-4447 / BCRC 22081 / CBS 7064 / NBRC 10061 / NRRL Y-12695) TaxID=559304 RepID=G8YH40_PICSO|nr:Piso0_003070 [Millerozyma farinosa CBS 7064]CCE80742.1 Piso0_003070 [Millerozyma farinosa CBS 7064]